MTTTVETRAIDEMLLAAAFQEIGAVTVRPSRDGSPHTQDVSVSLVRAVADEIEAAEPVCDHSVGICACQTIGVLEELRHWLNHMMTCPACNGDGYDWQTATTCPRCTGRGAVNMEDR